MKIKNLSISKHFNTNYREFALYSLINRGIPNFYDSLTDVQRTILTNTPNKYTKTLSIVGNCILNGSYSHGDASLGKAINRLARPYGIANRILEGDGFFGSQVEDEASAPRYTKVRISKDTSDYISKYKFLNEKDKNDKLLPLNLDFPIGLQIPAIGIAVGYKTTILPRKREHIESFLNGKRKTCKPYFKDFKGKISKYKDYNSTWIIEGETDINKNTIHIKSLPPIMKSKSFIKKVDKILYEIDSKVINESDNKIDFKITINDSNYEEIISKIERATKLIVKEFIILIKDDVVLEYDTIEDYLLDFKDKNEVLKRDVYNYYYNFYSEELNFLEAKKEFLKFMQAKKRTNKEVLEFYDMYKKSIVKRLDTIKLRTLNNDDIKSIDIEISKMKKGISEELKKLKLQEAVVKKLPKTLRVNNSRIELFECEDCIEEELEVFDIEDDEEYESEED